MVVRGSRLRTRCAATAFTHRQIRRRDAAAGLGHALIFYGFLVVFAGTVIPAFQDDVAKPLFGFDFWRGPFYLGYSLILDLFGFALVVGLAIMATKRAILRPKRLDYRRPDREENRSRYDARGVPHRGYESIVRGLVSSRLAEAPSVASATAQPRQLVLLWAPAAADLDEGARAARVATAKRARIDEAVALGELDYFVVACPKDVTMYEDAIKTTGHQSELELRELSELVLESHDR